MAGYGYGAAQGLEDVLARLYRDQVLAQQERNAEAQRAMYARQLDLQDRAAKRLEEQAALKNLETQLSMLAPGDAMPTELIGRLKGTPYAGLVKEQGGFSVPKLTGRIRSPLAEGMGAATNGDAQQEIPRVATFAGTPEQREAKAAKNRRQEAVESLPPGRLRNWFNLAAATGETPPAGLFEEPQEETITLRGVRGTSGRPVTRVQTKGGRVLSETEEYEPPRVGPAPDYEWVVGKDGQPRQIRRGTAQPGDKPYEKGGTDKPWEREDYLGERTQRVRERISQLRPRVGKTTVGLGGTIMGRSIPGTPAFDFAADVESLKSAIQMKELKEMRDASKTGGALGQVSDYENKMLQAAMGNLDPNQSPEQFNRVLNDIDAVLERWEAAKARLGGTAETSGGGRGGGAGETPEQRRRRLLSAAKTAAGGR